jgi:hypothetical protein
MKARQLKDWSSQWFLALVISITDWKNAIDSAPLQSQFRRGCAQIEEDSAKRYLRATQP